MFCRSALLSWAEMGLIRILLLSTIVTDIPCSSAAHPGQCQGGADPLWEEVIMGRPAAGHDGLLALVNTANRSRGETNLYPLTFLNMMFFRT